MASYKPGLAGSNPPLRPLYQFEADFLRFVSAEADRLVALAGMLASRRLEYNVLPLAGRRHLFVRPGGGPVRIIFAAHYDRFPGSPGVLDNACACLQLADLGARLSQAGLGRGIALLFTDGEEAPSAEGPLSQGSYALARGLRQALGGEAPPVLVLDVTGRGDRLILSTASAGLAERGRLARSKAVEASVDEEAKRALPAEGLYRLYALCDAASRRASIEPPARLLLPWSDDLGFTLGGLPAVALSLLPRAEAEALAYGGPSPETWGYLHSVNDGTALAEAQAFTLMSSFLDALASSIASG